MRYVAFIHNLNNHDFFDHDFVVLETLPSEEEKISLRQFGEIITLDDFRIAVKSIDVTNERLHAKDIGVWGLNSETKQFDDLGNFSEFNPDSLPDETRGLYGAFFNKYDLIAFKNKWTIKMSSGRCLSTED